MAQHLAVVGGVGDGVGLLFCGGRRCRLQRLGQGGQRAVVAQIQSVRVLALCAQQRTGQGDVWVGQADRVRAILAFSQGLICGGCYQI